MVAKKNSWVKNKSTVLLCGICGECGRELLNTDSGWIITHSKKYFCHDGKDGSCFDNYCERKYKENNNANGRKKEVQLYKSWKEKSKRICEEKRNDSKNER
jgi:hypothetical protein